MRTSPSEVVTVSNRYTPRPLTSTVCGRPSRGICSSSASWVEVSTSPVGSARVLTIPVVVPSVWQIVAETVPTDCPGGSGGGRPAAQAPPVCNGSWAVALPGVGVAEDVAPGVGVWSVPRSGSGSWNARRARSLLFRS